MTAALCMTFRTERLRFAILTFSANNRVSMIWDVCEAVLASNPRKNVSSDPILMKLRMSILSALPLLISLESITAHGISGSSAISFFEIATRAVSDDRAHRQQTIR